MGCGPEPLTPRLLGPGRRPLPSDVELGNGHGEAHAPMPWRAPSVSRRTLSLCLTAAAAATTSPWSLRDVGAFAVSVVTSPMGPLRTHPASGHLGVSTADDRETRGSVLPLARGMVATAMVVCALAVPRRRSRPQGTARKATPSTISTLGDMGKVPSNLDWNKVSTEWEIDCFSRPVQRDGKKMWELLLTDSNAVYRRVAQMKPTRVNSVVVQKIIQIFIEESKVKPRTIRFYRKVMKNMLTVALNAIKDEKNLESIKVLPSRNCHMLRQWLAYRERMVYPNMDGFLKTPVRRATPVQASMVQMAYEDLPERIRFGRYAISAIPLGSIAGVKPGRLPGQMCRIPPNIEPDTLIHGVIIICTRADVISAQLTNMELCGMRVNLETNDLLMDLGIDTTYKVTKVPTEDKESCLQFERSKKQLKGLHFVAIHNPGSGGEMSLPVEDDDGEEPDGCVTALWLCMDYAPEDK